MADFSDIRTVFQRKIDEGTLTNASLLIHQSGKEKLRCHLGWKDKERGVRIGSRPLYRLASMTKPITGAAVMIAAERGLIDIDAPLDETAPELGNLRVAVLNEQNDVISTAELKTKPTVRQLLCHCSGLGHDPVASGFYSHVFGTQVRSLREQMRFIADVPLTFQPGTRSSYNGVIGFNILARIVEIAADCPFEQFIQREIFNPLDMRDTAFFPTDAQLADTVVMYDYKNGCLTRHDLGRHNSTESCPYSAVGGWAGLIGSMEDYMNFAVMLLNEGAWHGKQILKSNTVREMRTPQLQRYPIEGERVLEWGLSMRVVTRRDDRLPLGCYGWSGAYKTHFWIDPAHELAAVFGTNVISNQDDHNPHFDFETCVADAIRKDDLFEKAEL